MALACLLKSATRYVVCQIAKTEVDALSALRRPGLSHPEGYRLDRHVCRVGCSSKRLLLQSYTLLDLSDHVQVSK